ncbi:hypoxanthine phosphoribosyltransferase [Gallaecimonas pentaromativorans]|uniref:Hypoxanthine phosphoribosyltransferase n=1 Tax=Gallaecimonas pentaromativorans TaxID=584787 RepID=A0A3N1PUS7_9GAMM|nr:hypoxanthine phosphoribosyltransferase [Gallaecimonas pentaromativorans]ROQ30490.1 hypoxanthine phosphoribosyltransferase [Gallaecimonas pentaromativorans]
MKHRVDVLISEVDVKARVDAMAREIENSYQPGDEILLVGLLRGSVVFLADLARALNMSAEFDFMTVSSYGSSMHSSRDVKIIKDLDEDIQGRHVLIVEDIIDTGNTLSKVVKVLQTREPKSIKLCTLLDKPSRREVDVPVDFIGFTIPDEFVVGYGIDWAQKYRNLPHIGIVVPLE